MSEPIPEAIPTSADPRSRRPVKRARLPGTTSTTALHASEIEYLMAEPERPIDLPDPLSSSKNKAMLPPPPEIVANVQGSSAGAGSGEFHVYKASRRREYERLRTMDEEAKREEDDTNWEEEQKLRREKDEEKARKNREKRNRKKEKGKGGKKEGEDAKGGQHKKSVGGIVKKVVEVPRRREDGHEDGQLSAAAVEEGKENGITIHDDD